MAALSRRLTAPGGQGVHANPLGVERVGGAISRIDVRNFGCAVGAVPWGSGWGIAHGFATHSSVVNSAPPFPSQLGLPVRGRFLAGTQARSPNKQRRRRWTSMSRNSPSWSTARHRYIRFRRSARPSRQGASDRSAEGDAAQASRRSRDRTSAPSAAPFRRPRSDRHRRQSLVGGELEPVSK